MKKKKQGLFGKIAKKLDQKLKAKSKKPCCECECNKK